MSTPNRIEIAEPAARVDRLLQTFDTDSKVASRELTAICAGNPSLFFGMVFRWMASTPSRNAASRFLAAMAIEEGHLLKLFEEQEAPCLEEAKLIVLCLTEGTPGLERVLLEKYLHCAKEGSLPNGLFLVLDVIAAIDHVGRTNSLLVQFLRSPNAKIRSKVAESLLKMTKSAETATSLLADQDPRVRANVVESLWPQAYTPHVLQLFRQQAESPVPRIAINALIGLYRGGCPEAASEITRIAMMSNPPMQRAAVWAMGHLAHEEFAAPLRELLRSGDSFLRGSVLRALVKINGAGRVRPEETQGIYAANTAIGKILLAGPVAWNRWRKTCSQPQPNLEGDSFYQMDLTGVDLSYCCLRGSDFEKATLNLGNLFGADLRDTNFRGARLNRSDLRGADISAGTCFAKAAFRGACLDTDRLGVAKTEGAQFDATVSSALAYKKAAEFPAALPQDTPAA